MRMTIEVDAALVEAAMKASGVNTRRELIEAGLRALTERRGLSAEPRRPGLLRRLLGGGEKKPPAKAATRASRATPSARPRKRRPRPSA